MFRPKNLQRDHPRACGAHKIYATMDRQHKGSSPRMRGSRAAHLHSMRRDGIIPAHAGLTTGSIFQMRKCRDHPRACGAHSVLSAGHQPRLGSSPRMRGSQQGKGQGRRAGGIIPAHAGLTSCWPCRSIRLWDHPRACGAHHVCPFGNVYFEGSSPRMRGSRPPTVIQLGFSGIIPAHAGLTSH